MITKYVGSVQGLLTCESIALVEIIDDRILQEADIPTYTVTYPGFSKIKLIYRDSEGIFHLDNSRDPSTGKFNFVLTHIIMYDSLSNPVGFANLTQRIDFDKYGVDSITVEFEYTIVNKVVYLNLDVDYLEHTIKTNNKLAHLSLFDGTKGGYKAVNKSDIELLFKTRQGFTKNIIDSQRNHNLLYRYSGYISKGTNYFWNGYWRVLREDLDQSLYQEIFEVNGEEILLLYCASLDGSKLIVYKHSITDPDIIGTRLEPLSMTIESPLHMGSNMILEKSAGGLYYIHSTADIIRDSDATSRKIGLLDNNVGFKSTDIPSDLRDGYEDSSDFKAKPITIRLKSPDGTPLSNLLKDPFTKVLRFYHKNGEIIESNDPEVREILSEFNDPKFENQSIIYASKGLIFTAQIDSDYRIISSNGIPQYGLYTYELPGRQEGNFRVPYYSSIGDDDTHVLCKSELDKRLTNCMISGISFITPNLFYINRSEYNMIKFRRDGHITWNDPEPEVIKDPNDHSYQIGAKDIPLEGDPDPYAYYLDYDYYNSKINGEKYLVEIGTDFDYSGKVYDYHTRFRFFDLKGKSGIWNYDKLLKSYDREARYKTLMNLTLNGNLYGYKVDSSGNYLIGRL